MRAVFLTLVAIIATTSPCRAAAPASFLYQLQNLDPARVQASGYSLVITDYSRDGSAAGAWSAAEIGQLRQGGTRTVLAYLSIGEAEDYRYYWQSSWHSQPPAWLGPANPDWPGNYKVRYWDPTWQALLFGSAEAYLDRILAQGFDGIYLDIVDAYEYWGPDGVGERAGAAADMVALVKSLADYGRRQRPGFLVYPQNGAGLGSFDPSYVEAVDGIGAEDTWSVGNRIQSRRHTAQVTAWLDRFRDAGKTVLAIDYPTRRTLRDRFYSRAAARGYVPSSPPRDLDRYVDVPGHPAGGGPLVQSMLPADGETVAPETIPVFSWNGIADAASYRLVFAGDEAFRLLQVVAVGRARGSPLPPGFRPTAGQWRRLLALAGNGGRGDLWWWVEARDSSGNLGSSRARRLHTYHRNVSTTVFWIGEDASGANGGIANHDSAWDECWLESYGGVDTPDARNGPLPAGFTPGENPFYLALPYNDLDGNGARKAAALERVPWSAATPGEEGQSILKNRWVEVLHGGNSCYGQWEDVGPFGENDAAYVFGAARPHSRRNRRAGLDVSPALRDCLGLDDGITLTGHGTRATPDHESTHAMTGFPHPGPLPEGEGDQGVRFATFMVTGNATEIWNPLPLGEGRVRAEAPDVPRRPSQARSALTPTPLPKGEGEQGVRIATFMVTAWRFVDAAAVPDGPWKQIVTTGGTRLGVGQCP